MATLKVETTFYKDGKPIGPPIQILKGVPIPPAKPDAYAAAYKAAEQMEVGDCIDVPYSRTGVASNLGRATGNTFTQRKIGDCLRIWRTA